MQIEIDPVDHGFLFVVGQDVCSQAKSSWQRIEDWQERSQSAMGAPHWDGIALKAAALAC